MGYHTKAITSAREGVAALPYAEVLHIKPAHRAERGGRQRQEAPAPRQCRQLCKYGSHGRLGGGRRRIPREAKCESPMGYHRKEITLPREGVAALPYTEFLEHQNPTSQIQVGAGGHGGQPPTSAAPARCCGKQPNCRGFVDKSGPWDHPKDC